MFFPQPIIDMVLSYIGLELLPWINIDKLNSKTISANPDCAHILANHPAKIWMKNFCKHAEGYEYILPRIRMQLHSFEHCPLTHYPYIKLARRAHAVDEILYCIAHHAGRHISNRDLIKNPLGADIIYKFYRKDLPEVKALWGSAITKGENFNILGDNIPEDIEGCIALCWRDLFLNPVATKFLERHQHQIEKIAIPEGAIPANVKVIHYSQSSRIDWTTVYPNPNAIHLIEAKLHTGEAVSGRDWNLIFKNPAAGDIIAAHFYKCNPVSILRSVACMEALSANPTAVRILTEYVEHVRWDKVSANPGALNLIEAKYIFDREAPFEFIPKGDIVIINHIVKRLQIDEAHRHKMYLPPYLEVDAKKCNIANLIQTITETRIDSRHYRNYRHYRDYRKQPHCRLNWSNLSRNPSTVHLLEHNQRKICWRRLSRNPAILAHNKKIIEELYALKW